MNKPLVVLEKERDFTDVINATFSFISQEFKLLMTVVLLYAGIPIVLAAIPAAIYSEDSLSNVIMAFQGQGTPQQPDFGMIFLVNGLMIIAVSIMAGIIGAYLALYSEKGHGAFSAGDVWNKFISKLGTFILFTVVATLIILFGSVLCLIPGIYLMVPLSLGINVIYMEGTDFGATFDRCFKIVKDNWWITFALILVVGLIVMILGGLFSLPAMMIVLVEGVTAATGDGTAEVNSMAVIVTTVIGTIGQYLLYIISYVSIGVQYFNLKEKKDQTSLFKKVSGITNE
jgi:hypothetical protein